LKHVLALLAFAFSVAIPASAASDYYLMLAPSATPIEINSFAFNGTDSVANAKAVFQNFVISKNFDSHSGDFVTGFLTSMIFPTATIVARKTSSTSSTGTVLPTPIYLTITLKNVVISQYSLTGNGSNEVPAEQISLSFSSASVVSTPASGGSTSLTYESSTNQVH
jgi:type VI protein secretion system component Hcp